MNVPQVLHYIGYKVYWALFPVLGVKEAQEMDCETSTIRFALC